METEIKSDENTGGENSITVPNAIHSSCGACSCFVTERREMEMHRSVADQNLITLVNLHEAKMSEELQNSDS